MPNQIIAQLEKTLLERKSAAPENSYVAALHQQGLDKILKKVIEEAGETLMAAKDYDHLHNQENAAHVVYEVADLFFHTMVMLSHLNIPFSAVETELAHRFGTSGIEEKNNRD